VSFSVSVSMGMNKCSVTTVGMTTVGMTTVSITIVNVPVIQNTTETRAVSLVSQSEKKSLIFQEK